MVISDFGGLQVALSLHYCSNFAFMVFHTQVTPSQFPHLVVATVQISELDMVFVEL